MNGIILYKDGHTSNLNNKKKLKYEDINSVLLEVKSGLYGTAFIRLTSKAFQKLRKIKNIKFKYRFLDGSATDLDDTDNPFVYFTYYYKDISELFGKLVEIVISEDILNDSFWVHDCYYCYCFDKLRIRYDKKNYRFKYNNFAKFYKDTRYIEPIECNTYISLKGKKYIESNNINKSDLEDIDTIYIRYGLDIYFKPTKKFIKDIDKINISTTLNVYECFDKEFTADISDEDFENYKKYCENYGIELKSKETISSEFTNIYTEHKFDYEYKNGGTLDNLFISVLGPSVISQIDSNNEYLFFRLFNRVKEVNGKKKRKRVHLVNFIRKYFKDIPHDDELDILRGEYEDE